VRRGLSGAPLATTNVTSAGASCKRRDAVRLAMIEAARPPGAASGVSSGSTSSWAACAIATGWDVRAQELTTPDRSSEQVDSEFLGAEARLLCALSADCTKVRALYPAV